MNVKKILTAGSIVLDIIPEIDIEGRGGDTTDILCEGKQTDCKNYHIYLGGQTGNTGLGLDKLGCSVHLVSKIGDDTVGTLVESLLQKQEIDYRLIRMNGQKSSCSVAIALPGKDKMTLHSRGASQTFVADDITERELEGADLFHFGYPTSMETMVANDGEELIKLIKKAKKQNVTVSLDTSLPDIHTALGQVNWRPILQKILPMTDIFMPSLEECIFMLHFDEYKEIALKAGAKNLLDQIDNQEMARRLAEEILEMGSAIAVIKCGSEGLYLRTAKEERFSRIGKCIPDNKCGWYDKTLWQKPVQAKKILSKTGAGDIAIAGFLASFCKSADPETAMYNAAKSAARCIECYDTISALSSCI